MSGNDSYPPQLTSTQKTKASINKRSVLPKTNLIQLFLEDSKTAESSSSLSAVSSLVKAKSGRLLPRFTHQQIISQLESGTATSSVMGGGDDGTKSIKAKNLISKEEKRIKELTRLCKPVEFDENNTNTLTNQPETILELRATASNRHSVTQFLAREFFLDCKQRLDLDTFKQILTLLVDYRANPTDPREVIQPVYELIRQDRNLCNKFSAFLTCDNAATLDLFEQAVQYEKSHELLQKLDMLISNKCALKKLLGQLASAPDQLLVAESDTLVNKIDEIRAKIKALTKNNQLINLELDYLFDPRSVNLEPSCERVSLINIDSLEQCSNSDVEHINLVQAGNQFNNRKIKSGAKSSAISTTTGLSWPNLNRQTSHVNKLNKKC